jgi:transposase
MHSIEKHRLVLQRLRRGSTKVRKNILDTADKHLVHCLCECAHNILNSNVPLSKLQYRKLARHKKTLRALVKRGRDWNAKKKIIKQKGGFLIPLLAPILGTLLAHALA